MINFIDERRLVDELIKRPKSINKDTCDKLKLLVKLFKEQGKTKSQVRDELDDFMYKYYNGFIMADWDSILQKITNKYTKPLYREFSNGKNINITYEELNFIKEKQDLEIEKLLFILLVLAKSSIGDNENRGLWVNVDSTYIFKLSKFKYDNNGYKTRMEQRELKISDLTLKGLVSPKAVCDSNDIKLLYGNSIKGNGLNFRLDDETSEDIIYHYLRWRGDNNIKECEVCGKLIYQKTNNPKKYCSKCAKIIKNEQNKISYKNLGNTK